MATLTDPHAYRLLFGTQLASPPAAGEEAMRLFLDHLDRLAAAARLRMPPNEAPKIVMAASSGIALALVLRPREFNDSALFITVRPVVYDALLADGSTTGAHDAPHRPVCPDQPGRQGIPRAPADETARRLLEGQGCAALVEALSLSLISEDPVQTTGWSAAIRQNE